MFFLGCPQRAFSGCWVDVWVLGALGSRYPLHTAPAVAVSASIAHPGALLL